MTTSYASVASDGAAGPTPVWPEDEARLLERLGGDSAVLATLATYFLEDAAPLAETIRAESAAGRCGVACRAAHTLRGMALNLSCSRLVQTTAAVEDALAAESGDVFQLIRPNWEAALADVVRAMRAYLERIGG